MPKSATWYSIRAAANETAEIYIYDYIGYYGVEASQFAKDLKALGKVGKIELHINSPGGDVFQGTAIYNLLKDHSAEVEVWIDGIAASMATVIALAGSTVHIAENAYFMIHNPSAMAWGDHRAMQRTKDLLEKVRNTMVNLYASRSGKTSEEIEQLMDDETWYAGAEAVEAGFATDTTGAIEMAASFDKDHLSNFKNTPAPVLQVLTTGKAPPPSAVADKNPPLQETDDMPKETTPAATATPAAPNTTTPPAPDNAVTEATFRENEKKRKDSVRSVFKGFDGHAELMAACLDDLDCDAAKAKDKLLTALGTQTSQPVHSYSVVAVEGDGIKRLRADAENALAVRALGAKRSADNGLVGYTLLEMARMMLQARNVNLAGMDKMRVVAAAFTHTSGDFASVLSNVANKAMLKGYEEADEVFTQFTAVGQLGDFKAMTRADTGSFPSLRQVKAGAEYKYVTLGERGETAILATYGELFSITRQAIINDDLGAFTRIPMKMGRAAVRTVGDLVFDVFLLNPVMADNVALFHADHANLLTAAGINTTSVDLARVAMATQTDNGATLNLRPKYFLVPPASEGVAKTTMASEFEVGASSKNNTIPNSVRGLAEPLSDGRLVGHNGWYLLADPAMHDTIEVLYLDGQQAPVLEQQDGWSIDGVEFKVRIDAAAKAWDSKGMVKTPLS